MTKEQINKLIEALTEKLEIATKNCDWSLMCYITGQLSVIKIIEECLEEK